MSTVVWVTGVAGFTGRHLVSLLDGSDEDLTVIGLDLQPGASAHLHAFHRIDLMDMSALGQLAADCPPDYVFHVAGLLPPHTEADMWRVNVGGTINVLQAIAKVGRKVRFVTIGSAAEYLPTGSGRVVETDPCPGDTPYGRVKWGQTTLALALGAERGIDVIVARSFNLVGPGLPGSLVAAQFCEQFAAETCAEIKVGNVESSRDFVDIRDAVEAYWRLARHGEAGQIYNVSTGTPVRIERLLDIFSKLSGGRHRIVVDQARLKSADADVVYGAYDKIHLRTGWAPSIPLQQSLSDMYSKAKA